LSCQVDPPPLSEDWLCLAQAEPGPTGPLVLVHLRKGEGFAVLAAGFGVGTATAWRYARETVTLLAVRAPKLRDALAAAKKAGHAFVVIDGTLIPIDRVAADRPFYFGKHRRYGMNLQVISSPAGEILWVSGPLPGATHDLTAARIWGILRKLRCCPWRAGQIAKSHPRPPDPMPLAKVDHGSAPSGNSRRRVSTVTHSMTVSPSGCHVRNGEDERRR
jgi:hypothetical protein